MTNSMILITGHKGYIGSILASKLGEFVGIDLKDGQNLLTCDLPKDIDLIFHLAAQSSVESSWHDPVHDMDNLRMTARLVKEYPNAKIIYTNSCASLNPKSPYGFSKKVAGDYLKIFHSNVVNLIFPNIYGAGGTKSVVDIFNGQEEVTVYGDGKQIRDYVHVYDIVDGLLKAQNWATGDYFLGSGKGTTVLELAQGKRIKFAPKRKEEREVVVPNTTPDWTSTISVLEYIQ